MPDATRRTIACLHLLALPMLAQATPDVRLDLASPPGAAGSHEVQIATSGNFAYAAWLDERSGQADVYLNRSLDGGATWLAQDLRLDTGTAPGAGRSTEVQLAVDGLQVCVVWTEDTGAPHIFLNRSLDGGATWLAAPRQMDVGAISSQMPAIACNGAFVYVAWSEARFGDPDIYFDRSLDGGTTWLGATVRIDTGAAPGVGSSYSPRIAAFVPNVYVVWDDFRSPNHGIYFNRSVDLGATFQPGDVALNSVVNVNGPNSGLPQIAASGPAVCVCWSDSRWGGSDIFFQGSSDSGATWLPADVRVDVGNLPGATRAGMPVIGTDGTAVHVAWRDGRNNANNGDIYYNRSLDGGLTWGSADVRLDTGTAAGVADSSTPQLAVAGPSVAVVWIDNRSGSYDIYANASADLGANWPVVDARLDRGSNPGASDSSRPSLASNGASFLAAWEDYRNGQGTDIYANLLAGYQPYGTGTPGTAGAVPLLGGNSAPVLRGTAVLEVYNGIGGAPGLLAIGAGPASRIAQPLLGGTLLVNPAATVFVVIGGSPGAPGGSTSVSVAVPANTGLLGLNMNFQGLLLDGGAVQGVSMTNGLALWIG